MHLGYAPTIDIPRIPADLRVPPRTTAPGPAVAAPVRPGTLVAYNGTYPGAGGNWITDGPCPCRCGNLRLWRREADGLHQLVHVSALNVAKRF